MSDNQVHKYDRTYGNLLDVSLHTKPSTIKLIQPLTGRAETFIIQTLRPREGDGDYIFIECIDEDGTTRIVLPPRVTAAAASQRDSLSKRNRSNASRATMRRRMDEGFVPSFKKRATTKKKAAK